MQASYWQRKHVRRAHRSQVNATSYSPAHGSGQTTSVRGFSECLEFGQLLRILFFGPLGPEEISATLLLLIEVLGCREDSEGLSELSKIKLFVMLNCAPFTSKMKVSGL